MIKRTKKKKIPRCKFGRQSLSLSLWGASLLSPKVRLSAAPFFCCTLFSNLCSPLRVCFWGGETLLLGCEWFIAFVFLRSPAPLQPWPWSSISETMPPKNPEGRQKVLKPLCLLFCSFALYLALFLSPSLFFCFGLSNLAVSRCVVLFRVWAAQTQEKRRRWQA